MLTAAVQGDIGVAEEINQRLEPLHKALFLESNPIPAKWALHEMGYVDKGIRLPLTVFSERYHDHLREAMAFAGVVC